MNVRRVPVTEWREMSETEQRAVIRAGMVDVIDLPEEFRLLVSEMLTETRAHPSTA